MADLTNAETAPGLPVGGVDHTEAGGPVTDKLLESAWEAFWAVRNPSQNRHERGKRSLRAALEDFARHLADRHAAELAAVETRTLARADLLKARPDVPDMLTRNERGGHAFSGEVDPSKLMIPCGSAPGVPASAERLIDVEELDDLRAVKARYAAELHEVSWELQQAGVMVPGAEGVRYVAQQLAAVNAALHAAGIVYPTGARGVQDLAAQRDRGPDRAIEAIDARVTELRDRTDDRYSPDYINGMEAAADLIDRATPTPAGPVCASCEDTGTCTACRGGSSAEVAGQCSACSGTHRCGQCSGPTPAGGEAESPRDFVADEGGTEVELDLHAGCRAEATAAGKRGYAAGRHDGFNAGLEHAADPAGHVYLAAPPAEEPAPAGEVIAAALDRALSDLQALSARTASAHRRKGHADAVEIIAVALQAVRPEAAEEPAPAGQTIQLVCEGGPADGQVPEVRYDPGWGAVPVPNPHMSVWTPDRHAALYEFARVEVRDGHPFWVYKPSGADPIPGAVVDHLRDVLAKRRAEAAPAPTSGEGGMPSWIEVGSGAWVCHHRDRLETCVGRSPGSTARARVDALTHVAEHLRVSGEGEA